jgi:hypothetical protein
MSVAITAQAPVAASSPATASPQASQGADATTEQGVADFAKARVNAGDGQMQIAQATNTVASSGEMIGKLREFIDKSHKTDSMNQATRAKQRAAAAEAKTDLATLDTLGSLGKLNSLSQFNPIGQSGSIGASLNRFGSVGGLHPGPASASLGGGLNLESPDLQSPGRLSAMSAKMTDDLMDAAIHRMWTQVVVHGTTSVTKSVMTLLKGQ